MPEGAAAPPGRACPAHYGYSPSVFSRPPEIEAETLIVAGGLYGNLAALDAIEALLAQERGNARLVFNGDFHWFDVDPHAFDAVEAGTQRHIRLRGNVETEIAAEPEGFGCACAYPAGVRDEEVERSNRILERLRDTARAYPEARARLARLPAVAVARVGEATIGIVHGDAESIAGWRFDAASLDGPSVREWLGRIFADGNLDIFASSHTCRAVMRAFNLGGRVGVVANYGAAGMPNFVGERQGLVTRIGIEPCAAALYRTQTGGAFVEALPVRYDVDAFARDFLRQWPPGSPAHASYWRRIASGTSYPVAAAAPGNSSP